MIEDLNSIGGSTGLLMKIRRSLEERKERQAELRKEHPDVTCLECLDTGEVNFAGSPEPCFWCEHGQALTQAREAERVRKWRVSTDEQLGIPPLFRTYSFEHVDLPRNEPPLSTVKHWASGTPRRWLYLYGAFGRGKSALAAVALRNLVWAAGKRDGYQRSPRAYGQFLTVAGMLQSLRPKNSTDISPQQRIERYQGLPYLTLDDLGAERLTAWGAEQVFEVLNERSTYQRPTIITSNYELDKLETMLNSQRELVGSEMGTRLCERVREATDMVAFPPGLPNFRRLP